MELLNGKAPKFLLSVKTTNIVGASVSKMGHNPVTPISDMFIVLTMTQR
jgi:hypothetical protein